MNCSKYDIAISRSFARLLHVVPCADSSTSSIPAGEIITCYKVSRGSTLMLSADTEPSVTTSPTPPPVYWPSTAHSSDVTDTSDYCVAHCFQDDCVRRIKRPLERCCRQYRPLLVQGLDEGHPLSLNKDQGIVPVETTNPRGYAGRLPQC